MSERRLLLVNPVQSVNGKRQKGWNSNRLVPPISLGYVAALTPNNWQIRILDENAGDDAMRLTDFTPDLVGISSYTSTITRAYDLAAHFRGLGIPVVIGGWHATAVPEEVCRYADVAFVGQAEGAWPQVIEDFEAGKLQPIYYGGTPPLESLRLPRRDLYPHHYFADSVITAKGCPFRCEFCSVWKMYGQRYQTRPVSAVLDEVAQIKSKVLFFADDNFNADRRHALALCRGLVERGIHKRFGIQATMDLGLDDELLDCLQRAGCVVVLLGVESVEEDALRHYRKAVNLRIGVSLLHQIIERIHKHGMAVFTGIIFGSDSDTLATFQHLESFVEMDHVDSPIYTILTPMPGTDLWQRLQNENRLLYRDMPADYAYCDTHHVLFVPKNIAPNELLYAHRTALNHAFRRGTMIQSFLRTWRHCHSFQAALVSWLSNRMGYVHLRSVQKADKEQSNTPQDRLAEWHTSCKT